MPTVTVVTQAFVSLAASAATVLGYTALPVVVVGHPVATLSVEAVRAMAEEALPKLLAGLTEPPTASSVVDPAAVIPAPALPTRTAR